MAHLMDMEGGGWGVQSMPGVCDVALLLRFRLYTAMAAKKKQKNFESHRSNVNVSSISTLNRK